MLQHKSGLPRKSSKGFGLLSVSEHMRVLTSAKLVRAKRIRQWTMYRRNEAAIDAVKRAIEEKV